MAGSLNFKNFAKSTLSENISESSQSFAVSEPSLFPDGEFTAVIWSGGKGSPLDDPESEIITAQPDGSGSFTALRGREGTYAKAWTAGANIANVITAETMEFLYGASSLSASITEVSANIYDMQRSDTSVHFIFSESESIKTITLPEAALCQGLTYHLINLSEKPSQTVRLFPFTGDVFRDTPNTFVQIAAKSAVSVTPSGTGWLVSGYAAAGPSGIKMIDISDTSVSMGDGVVYADASGGDLYITLPGDEGIYGKTLTIIKYDESDNFVYIDFFDNTPGAVELYAQHESATFIKEKNLSNKMISRYSPDESAVVTLTASGTLRANHKLALCETGSSDITLSLPIPALMRGRTLTVKKTDSGAGAVLLDPPGSASIDGEFTASITDQFGYISVSSDGSIWHRVG